MNPHFPATAFDEGAWFERTDLTDIPYAKPENKGLHDMVHAFEERTMELLNDSLNIGNEKKEILTRYAAERYTLFQKKMILKIEGMSEKRITQVLDAVLKKKGADHMSPEEIETIKVTAQRSVKINNHA